LLQREKKGTWHYGVPDKYAVWYEEMRPDRSSDADSYALLQAGLDHINQGFSVFDRHLRLVGWNQKFLELLDFPDWIGHRGTPFETLIRYNAERGEYGPGDAEQQVAERVEQARRFEPHFFERTRPTGEILAIRGDPLPEGGFVTVYTDVTEQRHYERLIREQNEELERRVRERTADLHAAHDQLLDAIAKQKDIAEALAVSESRLQLIIDRVPAGIAYWDKDVQCLFANRRFATAFGRRKEECIGRPATEVVGDETLAELQGYVDRVLGGESVTFEYEATLARRRPATVRTNLIPEINEHGEVAGFFILSLDITRQKKAETAILQAEKMEAVGQLSSGIAHDFNNLLTVVLGNLIPFRDRCRDPDDRAEFLDPAIEAARKGAKLTDRLLSFARRQPLSRQPVDVEDLVAGMVRLFRRSLPNDIEIVTATGGQPYPALVDPHQLENALLNLAINARDAMPKGGRLAFETTFLTVPEHSASEDDIAPGEYVRIGVQDTGGGMDPATRARVFEPFFTTKQGEGGSGLGLSMVYGFVKQSHGAIRIESEPSHGTKVVILLPRARQADESDDVSIRSGRFRAAEDDLLLLVEDNEQVRAVVRRQLTDLGYRLIEAGDADEALELLENVPDFTVLVSDIVMPGAMTGIDLGERARAVKPDLKIILMTGYAGRDRMRDLDTCPFPVLRKPFDQVQLVTALTNQPT
jgi:PAS domain S-box-containing protein